MNKRRYIGLIGDLRPAAAHLLQEADRGSRHGGSTEPEPRPNAIASDRNKIIGKENATDDDCRNPE
jgi:hypothetical protein